MKEITIKSYTRKGKNGKVVTVKSYTRRVGKKGIKSPKRTKAAGQEYQKLVDSKPKSRYRIPQMTDEELKRWDALARKDNNLSCGRIKQLKEKSKLNTKGFKRSEHKKKETIFDKIDRGLDKFINKYK